MARAHCGLLIPNANPISCDQFHTIFTHTCHAIPNCWPQRRRHLVTIAITRNLAITLIIIIKGIATILIIKTLMTLNFRGEGTVTESVTKRPPPLPLSCMHFNVSISQSSYRCTCSHTCTHKLISYNPLAKTLSAIQSNTSI